MNLIQGIWSSISLLGLSEDVSRTNNRTVILGNQINFLMLLAVVFVLVLLQVMRIVEGASIGMGSIRMFLILIVNLAFITLSKYRKFFSAKVILIYLPPLLFLVFPTLTGFVEEESFFYYPIVVIAMSLMPQMLLDLRSERKCYLFAMAFYTTLILGIDVLIYSFAPKSLQVLGLYKGMVVFYKSAYFVTFLFVNISIYYLRHINMRIETDLHAANDLLLAKGEDLQKKNEALDASMHKLKQAQHQMIQSEKMASLGTLMAGIAHEVNTPLNYISAGSIVVQNALDDIADKSLSAKEGLKGVAHGKEMVDQGVDKAINIVASLRTFSYSGKADKQWHNFNEVIESTLRFLKQKIPAELELRKDYSLEKKVPMYADKIHQIVLNLIDNALYEINKYEGEKPILLISTTVFQNGNGPRARLTIYNTGKPIEESIGSKIFDPFYTTKPPGLGTGLGLSTSYKLASEHNGSLRYKNTDDGVEFILELPLLN
ncbi:sensor histidine kinase [Carboxylicivirga sp. N1Y90]|uniref:sensor histidine kinase n=1 Tax=Carboxylicivirga fragile TaxID=3417571 RepID=UPI003D34AA0E|nr:HAMP domain-containing histidine kinase [Marinilabiliaceae bacterium N1Y90]